MSPVFFKSNAEGAEVVSVIDGFIRRGMSINTISRMILNLRVYHDHPVFSWAVRMRRLRRQHKAKGRGKNWRNVR